MLSVLLGGYYFGFFGLILTVPALFSCKVILGELMNGLQHKALNIRMEAQSRTVANS